MAARKPHLRGSAWRRRLDMLLGVPLLWVLGQILPKRRLPAEVQRVVLLQTAAIGDTLLMTQAVRRVRAALPAAKLVLALGRDNQAVCPLLPQVDGIVMVNPLQPWSALRRLRALRADVLVDYGPWPRVNALLAALAGARFTVGFNTPGQARHYAYDLAVSHSNQRHEVENQRALLYFLGATNTWDLSLVFPDGGQGEQPLLKGEYLVFHAWASGAGKRLKEWPLEHWVVVARWAAAQHLSLVLTGGRVDQVETEAMMRQIHAQVPSILLKSIAGSHTLAETAQVVRNARAVVSVNTGLLHLAALSGVNTIGLHGPTNPRRWGPYGAKAIALLPDRGQIAYLNLGFEFPRQVTTAMPDLRPEQVIDALVRFGVGRLD